MPPSSYDGQKYPNQNTGFSTDSYLRQAALGTSELEQPLDQHFVNTNSLCPAAHVLKRSENNEYEFLYEHSIPLKGINEKNI